MKETKFKQTLVQTKKDSRHCEERSDAAIHFSLRLSNAAGGGKPRPYRHKKAPLCKGGSAQR